MDASWYEHFHVSAVLCTQCYGGWVDLRASTTDRWRLSGSQNLHYWQMAAEWISKPPLLTDGGWVDLRASTTDRWRLSGSQSLHYWQMKAEWISEPPLLTDGGWVDLRASITNRWRLGGPQSHLLPETLPHRQCNSDSRVSSQHLLVTEERHGNLGPDACLVQIPIWDLQNAKRSLVSRWVHKVRQKASH